MRTKNFKDKSKAALRVLSGLSFAAVVAFGQQQANMTAGPASLTMPDGSTVPMWGYSCGATVAGSTATCAKLNPAATGWSPVVITIPTTATGGLTINLTNNLPSPVPTSLMIVGQLGGGLGTTATSTPSPVHSPQPLTWPVAGGAGDPTNTPPGQGPRVRSFSTEVIAGATTLLPAWANLRPGTYLIESGTHPSIQGPMGLYGMLVVTDATTGTAYPGVTYNADVKLLLSEIDPVQNNAVQAAVTTAGFSETMVWSGQPGGCGNPSSPTYHQCYPPAVNYSPLYYLFNGVAFSKTSASASLFPASPATGVTGNVLVRMVNAGLRMHVPSIVGAQTGSPAVSGLSLIAEDGNPLPGVTRVQSSVFLAPGKTYDVKVNVPAVGGTALPVFDRQLSLSGNATSRDAGMLAYIGINGAGLPSAAIAVAAANPDTYNSVIAGKTLTVSDPGKGVIANDVNVYGVKVVGSPVGGSVTLNTDGTFTFVPSAASGSFQYCGNGATSGPACATVTLGAAVIEAASGITLGNDAYTSTVATALSIKSPGVLLNDKDAAGYPLIVDLATVAPAGGLTLSMDKSGAFTASVAGAGTYTFTYKARNSQGTLSASTATATLTFPAPTNLQVSVVDGKTKTPLAPQDYRWIIEEDRTFFTNPANVTNTGATGSTNVSTLGTNFHTSHMPIVAQGCTGDISCESGQTVLDTTTGNHVAAACDIGNGVCRPAPSKTPVFPSQVVLDPLKRYYISILPGDAVDPGHAMGGAQIAAGQASVTVLVEPTPLPPGKVSVFVFQDDSPLNGEHDASGGIDTLAPFEPGLGQFNITLFDDAGGTGDATGQMTYDMFNMPLSNSLSGTKDPVTGKDACPISQNPLKGFDGDGNYVTGTSAITAVITVCPKFESDGTTLSPLAGQAVIDKLPPGRYGVVATPGADRIARGEEWLQTNTLDGGKAHDSFIKVSEPSYFQEYGPAGYHVSVGFANPAIINARKADVCATTTCTSTVTGKVTGARMSRTPDERLYSSGSRDTYAYTQCYASLGGPDSADFAFQKCNDDGTFTFTGIPQGDWRVTIFDQWNDQVVDGISEPVRVNAPTVDMGEIAAHQWKADIYTRTFFDANGDGVSQPNEKGLSLVPTNIRFRDGSFSNFNSTDLEGFAGFNEIFPLFNWYTIETDSNRFKNTGTHVVYDAGGPADGSPSCGRPGNPTCGTSSIGAFMARTKENVPLPANLRVPGSVYCDNADCTGFSIANGPGSSASSNLSTGRIDPPWVTSYGWQGFAGQNSFLEFGKKPYAEHENGGIRGHVVYASTRPFDDPALLLQLSWEPMVPHVTINLYQEGTAPDRSQSLQLVDTTQTSSFDDWAQGFRSDGVPNMNCPGQITTDPFFFTLKDQPMHLNPGAGTIPNNSQFKCFDGQHNWNQLQPAPYDGMYAFPSVTSTDPTTGKPAGTNCTICTANNAAPVGDWSRGLPMLPAGKYVVEVVVPPNYELVKEEDKNILLGDAYIGPVTTQFAGLGNIFIMPDQASVAATYNANNAQNSTTDLGAHPRHEGDTGSIETFWPCVGQERVVPDFVSLFPGSQQVSPFAGATRRLCDRKEVTLDEEMQVLAKFYVFTSTHIAAHFTGVITDDLTAEFDPFSPQFGEKFAPANLPVSVKDWAGNEVSRVYADQWGAYNGLNYSTYGVNPPAPTGYVPTMMVLCMNDAGTGATPDRLFQKGYSQFCYELPFMPGQTGYFDTPVVPTAAYTGGYNNADCAYPDATPAISSVDGDGVGPWISASGTSHPITIHALGDLPVDNYGYSGPSATTAPFNQQSVTRHYGFGATQGTGSVTIGGVAATVTSWSDTTIVVTLPSTGTQVAACGIQQRNTPTGTTTSRCGELVITAGNGKQSIDTVTVTIGGKAPTRVAAGQTIQSVIDAAAPGDLIIVPPGNYTEMLLMWKPVRLQGVGSASSVINANTHPSSEEKLGAWRRQVVCLFGLAINGLPITTGNPYDAPGGFTCTNDMRFKVDRLPLEATVGWDASLNGNLAEQLQEPTLMGAYEGAVITVLSKGVDFHGGDPFAADTFPDGTTLLGTSNANCSGAFTSNFKCNPSRIDGLSLTNSSQGGGGILVHAWGHNLEIANNRIHNNQGTLSGGIQIGQGEHPTAYLGGAGVVNAAPGSCQSGNTANVQLPYCFDVDVNVHHNAVTLNSSSGDELFSATPAGAGGATFCTGADNYLFNYNWVCGNLSIGDGGGVAQLGFAPNGRIEHNSILFNQSTNPTVATNGGGIIIMGAPDIDPNCPGPPDADCGIGLGLGDGTGNGLLINANLIMGNSAESGSGGGIRFQGVNGSDVSSFPTTSSRWYSVNVTNNIITNNVAGWDGAGVSLNDSLVVNFINNTVASNDSTASSGVLFGAFFAPQASDPSIPPCISNCGNDSAPQAAGLVATGNSPGLIAALPASPSCPTGHSNCKRISNPLLDNNVFWQNRSFHISVGALGGGNTNQQNVVILVPTLNQPNTGACVSSPSPSYWDIGVRGDTGPTNHSSGFTLSPRYSVLTDTTGYAAAAAHNTAANPAVASQYCNGSRMPPEFGGMGYQVPPGTFEGNGSPLPLFNLTAGATVDEGNNWINIRFGPLALASPVTGTTLGDYGLNSGSPVINYVPSSATTYSEAPSIDFFGTARKTNNFVDAGAVEFVAPTVAIVSVAGGPLNFGNVPTGTNSGAQTLTLSNTGGASLTGITLAFSSPLYHRAGGAGAGTCGVTLVPGTCTINVVFSPTATGLVNATLAITGNVVVTGSPVSLSGTGIPPAAIASVTGGPLAFGNVPTGTTSTARTLTLRNTGTVSLTGITLAFSQPVYTRSGGTCAATLAAFSTCTINVVLSPAATGLVNATLTITGSVGVTGSPVSLSGTGVAPVVSATLTPATWSPSATRGVGLLGPAQLFTLTNTGNVTLTGITQGALGGANASEFVVIRLLSTCGPAGGGQLASTTTLAPGATCGVTVSFEPLTAQTTGVKSATVSVTDLAGTQTSTLTGTAN